MGDWDWAARREVDGPLFRFQNFTINNLKLYKTHRIIVNYPLTFWRLSDIIYIGSKSKKGKEQEMIAIEYCNISSEMAKDGLIGDAFSQASMEVVKAKVLAKMDIMVQPGEAPLAAWIRHLSNINDLPYTSPCHPDLARAIFERAGAARFMFFLS